MGKMTHVIKKMREYGGTEAFNYNQDGFVKLLSTLGCNVSEYEDEIDYFEVSASTYKKAIKVLELAKKYGYKNIPLKKLEKLNNCGDDEEVWEDDYFNVDWIDFDDLESSVTCLGALDDVISIMKAFYRERDKHYNWIAFEAF
jgi:hypothetical protein